MNKADEITCLLISVIILPSFYVYHTTILLLLFFSLYTAKIIKLLFLFLCSSYGNHSSLNPKSIYVRLGSDFTSSDGETVPVQELHFHPDFEPDILKNNLVLIRLEKRIRFSKQQPRIRRILYDTAPQVIDPDEEGVLILGWGSTSVVNALFYLVYR